MSKFAIIKDSGEYVKCVDTRIGYRFVNMIEQASMFKDKHIANNVLLSIKYHNRMDFEQCRVVEVEITYTVKEVA